MESPALIFRGHSSWRSTKTSLFIFSIATTSPSSLGELDTIFDLSSYLDAKLEAIRRYDGLMYCGEEDLLAHYFLNFDEAKNLAPALRVVGVGGDRRARRNCTPWHGYGATAEGVPATPV